jgi:hypothetical protein
MTVSVWWQGAPLSMVVLLALWLLFLVFLVIARPDTGTLTAPLYGRRSLFRPKRCARGSLKKVLVTA